MWTSKREGDEAGSIWNMAARRAFEGYGPRSDEDEATPDLVRGGAAGPSSEKPSPVTDAVRELFAHMTEGDAGGAEAAEAESPFEDAVGAAADEIDGEGYDDDAPDPCRDALDDVEDELTGETDEGGGEITDA